MGYEDVKLNNVGFYKKYCRFLEEAIETMKTEMKAIKNERAIEKGTFEEVYQCTPDTYRF